MTDSLLLALPSKGRIHDEFLQLLARAGLGLKRRGHQRSYAGELEGLAGVDVRLLSASDIAQALPAGAIHAGITGLDLLEEGRTQFAESIDVLLPLGISRARVIVAVPEVWLDIRSMADLYAVASRDFERQGRRMRVATKFHRLTRRFFSGHGILDYRIVDSLGATEGAPASGAADIIVDITETGSTLAANRLRILDDGLILESEAVLALAKAAPGAARAKAEELAARLRAALSS